MLQVQFGLSKPFVSTKLKCVTPDGQPPSQEGTDKTRDARRTTAPPHYRGRNY